MQYFTLIPNKSDLTLFLALEYTLKKRQGGGRREQMTWKRKRTVGPYNFDHRDASI